MRMRASKILQAAKALKKLPSAAGALSAPIAAPGPTALERLEPNAPKPAARDKKPRT